MPWKTDFNHSTFFWIHLPNDLLILTNVSLLILMTLQRGWGKGERDYIS